MWLHELFPFLLVVCISICLLYLSVRHDLLIFYPTYNFQSMEKDFRFSTMKLGRNMMHILITSLMSSTPRMGANGLPLFWCICKTVSPFRYVQYIYYSNWFSQCSLSLCHFLCHWFRSDVEEGGETVFPAAKGSFNSVRWWNELSECGKQGLSVKPKMGDALLFWSMRPDASLDPSSLHG